MVIILIGLRTSTTLAVPPPDMKPGFPDVQLSARMHGDEAVAALGNNFSALADYYKTTPEELRARMHRDKSLWVDPRGRLLYICDWGSLPATNQSPADFTLFAVFPYPDTFRLHSRLGASKVIYLDFDGHNASASSWGSDAISRPFDTDGDPTTFSTAERDKIQFIWQRVAEDYALYDIDVTTEDPGLEALRKSNSGDANYGIRAVIGGAYSDWFDQSAGGVAHIGAFDASSDDPCWIFPKNLGPDDEKDIAEAISHEVGHTLGLSHDGTDVGTVHTEYYGGQGNWAPIMGVGYSRPITQWSKGEYANANNTQDDLAVMLTHGAAYRADDHGNNIATATVLNGVAFSASGNIEQNTDVDYFSFQTGAGRVNITATPAPRGPNLHILLSLYNASGTLITSTNTTDTSAGVLPTTLSVVLPTGNYFFSIDGVGADIPLTTGYSDYASLGQYTITGTLPSDSTWLPTSAGAFSWTNSGIWSAASVPLGADAIARMNINIFGDQTINLDMPIKLGKLLLGDSVTSHAFNLQSGLAGSLIFNTTAGPAGLAKTSGVTDTIAAPVVLLSDLAVTNTTPVTDLIFSGSISGSGALLKYGTGHVTLSASNSYTGSTMVSNGVLALDITGSIASSAKIDVRPGAKLDATLSGGLLLGGNQTLGGGGIILGDVTTTNGTQIAPGTNSVAGTLSFSNNLVLNSGTKLNFDLANTTTPGSYTNDLIIVAGDLTLNGTVIVDFNFLNSFPASPATYTLMTYGGTLTGGAGNLIASNAANRYVYTFDDSVPGEIRVQVSGAPTPLTWQGDGSLNRWDVQSTANWLDAIGPSQFAQLDTVAFTDAGSVSPGVSLLGAVRPNSVTVNSANNYTFTGTGRISGATTLTKQGPGTLTISTSNDYSGVTLVSGGILKAGNGGALGNVTNGTTVAAGAALDVNALNLGAEAVTAQGAGPTGTGAITSSSAVTQSNALRFVTLAGDTTFGGTGRWDIRANPTGSFTGNNFTLTKTNANEIWLADLGSSGLGDINVLQGTLAFRGSTTMGDSTKTITLATNATLAFWNTDYNTLSKKLVMNNSALTSLSGDNIFSGPIALNGSNAINVADILTLQGSLGGPDGFTKLGGGTLALTVSNSFAGSVLVSAGTLQVRNIWALGTTNSGTTVASGARLDVNGINLGAEPVTVTGTGLGSAGAIVNSGGSQQNALRFVTLTGNTTFGGIGRWDIRANPTGSLNVTNFNLTKVGNNEVWLANLGTNGLNGITCGEGILGFIGTTTLGNPAGTATITANGTLGISALVSNVLLKAVTVSSGRVYASGGTNVITGTMSLISSGRFEAATSTGLILGSTIGGSGAFTSLGAGVVILTNNNTYSGLTTISAGTLQVGDGNSAGSLGTGNITNNSALTFNRAGTLVITSQISGPGVLNQNGPGTLTLSGNNSYGGNTTINAGTLAVGTDTAIGTNALVFNQPLSVSATFRSANASPRTITNYLAMYGTPIIFGAPGTGDLIFNGLQAIANSGPIPGRTLIVSNNVTTINNAIGAALGFTNAGPGTLVLGGNNTHVAPTTLLLGTLRIDAENRLGGNPGTFKIDHLAFGGGALQTTATFAIDDPNRGIRLNVPGGTFNVDPGTTLTLATPVSGAGSLTKSGAGTLAMTAPDSFTGGTFITTGTLALIGSGTISSSSLIRVDGGALFDVSGVSGTYTLAGPQTLGGNGTINGNVIANGTVAPGNSIGALTFNNTLTLAGTTVMETSKTGSVLTNDLISVNGTLTYGGILNVVHTGGTLTNGDSFKLFNAPGYGSSFATRNLPALNPGLRWDTTQLATSGTIQVAILTSPTILPVTMVGTNLMISIASDVGVTYVLQATDDLSPPVTWSNTATNAGTGATLSFPTPVDAALPDKYFRIIAY